MTEIATELDRLLDEADWKAKRAERAADHRGKLSRSVFEAHRRRQLAPGAQAHPLRRCRLTFREGLTVDELAERAAVGASTIHDLEAGKQGSDLTWERLCRALSVRRAQIDPTYIYTG